MQGVVRVLECGGAREASTPHNPYQWGKSSFRNDYCMRSVTRDHLMLLSNM